MTLFGYLFGDHGEEEDDVIAESYDVIANALADADFINIKAAQYGRNMREQWTLEELLALEQEAKLRRFKRRN